MLVARRAWLPTKAEVEAALTHRCADCNPDIEMGVDDDGHWSIEVRHEAGCPARAVPAVADAEKESLDG